MKLRWEQPRQGLARGFGDNGHELAQVAHVYDGSGDDLGWAVHLVYEQSELFDRFGTVDQAMAAAEAALEPEQADQA